MNIDEDKKPLALSIAPVVFWEPGKYPCLKIETNHILNEITCEKVGFGHVLNTSSQYSPSQRKIQD